MKDKQLPVEATPPMRTKRRIIIDQHTVLVEFYDKGQQRTLTVPRRKLKKTKDAENNVIPRMIGATGLPAIKVADLFDYIDALDELVEDVHDGKATLAEIPEDPQP